MSEKIYAWLLRLYPSHFREAYGEAALQLFRDRYGHERGFFPAVRLWLDLLSDLAISVPRQHYRVRFALISRSRLRYADGTPSFHILEGESPCLGVLVLGALLSLSAVAASIPIGHIASYRPLVASSAIQPPAHEQWPGLRGRNPQLPGDPGERTVVSGAPDTSNAPIHSRDASSQDFHPLLAQLAPQSQPTARPPRSQEAARILAQDTPKRVDMDTDEKQRVLRAIIANLKDHYVDPAVAQQMEEALLAHEKAGDYAAIGDGAGLAALVTRHLREVSHDTHLEVVYSRNPLPERSTGPSPERMAAYRKVMEANNCTFEKIQILSHNIGYLKLNSFPEPSICATTAKAAMASLNHADAIIFDLRENRGGYPSMVMLIAAYLFDHPEYMYRPGETTELCWTQSPVPGNRLADKPVYVLTSARTFSGAEHFSYDLKMLKRATLVGERTAGATDVGVFHRIDDHFGIGIREAKAINPYSEPDWAVTGVQPDVKVKAADALVAAEKLAQTKLQKK